MTKPSIEGKKRYRTLFLSDVHLGTRSCQAELLLDFLRHHDAGTIYLVGDIVDVWRMRRKAHWPQAHNDVIQKLLRKVRKGTRVVFLPGNHDDQLRAYCGSRLGGVEIVDETVHTAADGRRMLVIHGDQFDVVVRHARWLAHLGDKAYELAMALSSGLNVLRRNAGLGRWSLSAYLKQKVKNAVCFIGDYEAALVGAARRTGTDGVICGHIHHAAIRDVGGILYVNLGDWVESATAVGETEEGRFEIIRWIEVVEKRLIRGALPAAA